MKSTERLRKSRNCSIRLSRRRPIGCGAVVAESMSSLVEEVEEEMEEAGNSMIFEKLGKSGAPWTRFEILGRL